MRIFKVLILFLLIPIASFSQLTPDSEIDLEKFDKQYLEHLTKIKIDSVREHFGLNPLINDSILYIAACDHSSWLLENKKTGHYQTDSIKKTPQNRVNYYGGWDYVSGENVISSFVNKKVKLKPIKDKKGRVIDPKPIAIYKTYGQMATALAHGWVHSPRHYENMRRPQWVLTGLCIQIDKESKLVKGTQLFAFKPLQFEFDENKEMFPYSTYKKPEPISSFDHPEVQKIPYQKKLPYKIKAPKKETKKLKEFKQLVQQGMFYKGHRGNFIDLTMMKPKMVEKIFKKKKNGVAVEIVTYAPYHPGNPDYYLEPSRRNKKSAIKGQILKPVYKKELLNGFDPEQDQVHTVNIGVDLKNYSSFPEFNIIFLYKKKIAHVMHFTGPCGDPYGTYEPQDMVSEFKAGYLEFPTTEDSIRIVVDYKRNQVKLDSVEFQALRDSVPEEQIKIHKAVINAYSSIEGTTEINVRLMKERTENMFAAIQPYIHDSTKVEKNAVENWEKFYEQIKTSKYKKLANYSKEKIKELLADTNKRKRLDDMLYEQRTAEIKLWYTARVKDSAQHVLNYYRELVNMMSMRKKASAEEARELNFCYDFLYKSFMRGNLDTNSFRNLEIPLKEGVENIAGNHVWWEYSTFYQKNPLMEPSKDFLARVKFVTNSQTGKPIWKYNALVYYLDLWTEDHPAKGSPAPEVLHEVLDTLLKYYDNSHKDVDLVQLQLNFHFKAAYYYYANYDFQNRDRSAMYLFRYYAQRDLDDTTALKIGKAFTNLMRGDLAAMLLGKYAMKMNPNKELLSLYLKLLYKPVDHGLDKEYYKLLMDSYTDLGKEYWCDLFLTSCSISFQAFDCEELRNFYCEKCANRKSEATKAIIESLQK